MVFPIGAIVIRLSLLISFIYLCKTPNFPYRKYKFRLISTFTLLVLITASLIVYMWFTFEIEYRSEYKFLLWCKCEGYNLVVLLTYVITIALDIKIIKDKTRVKKEQKVRDREIKY